MAMVCIEGYAFPR